MSRFELLAGVAGFSLIVSGGVIASAGSAAAQECSGLGCIFGSRLPSAEPQRAPSEAQALDANQRAAQAEAAADGKLRTSPDAKASGETPAATAAAKPKPAKPVHVVTIAADAPEVGRLERLAEALPKEKIKIVTSRGAHDRTASDFTVSTALDAGQGAEKAKLFTEQMHIVAGGAIHSVADLEGKVVSFGPDKSPGQAAARKAFAALNVHVNETPLDLDNALDGLSTGDVAALVLLAPQPIDRLKSVKAPGVHLVSWPQNADVPDGATVATIDGSDYPSLAKPGETIRAMGVDVTLTMNAKGAKQAAAKVFLKALAQHSEALTKRGFDLLKADLEGRTGRRLASADKP